MVKIAVPPASPLSGSLGGLLLVAAEIKSRFPRRVSDLVAPQVNALLPPSSPGGKATSGLCWEQQKGDWRAQAPEKGPFVTHQEIRRNRRPP